MTGEPERPNDGQIRWLLIGLVACAAFLRAFFLGRQSLWYDEGTTLDMTDSVSFVDNFRRFYHLFTGGERFQPLYNLLLPYWRHGFGDGEVALRSFSALAGFGAVVLVVLTARRVFGGAHAVWTAALAAFSAFAVFYSQEARPYALLMLLSSAQVYCLTPILAGWTAEQSSPWWRRAHTVVVFIGSFGSIFFVMFAAALSAAHLVVRRDWREWLRWWIPAAVAAAPALMFFLGTGQARDPVHSVSVARHGFPLIESVMFVVYGVLVGITYGPSVLDLHGDRRWAILRGHGLELVALFLVLFAVVMTLTRVLWRGEAASKEQQRAGLFLVIAAVVVLLPATALAAITRVTWLPRHSFYLWIPIVLLVPLIRHAPLARGRWRGVTIIVAFLGLNGYSLYKHYFRYEYSKGDYRGVAHYIMAKENLPVPSVLAYGFLRLLRYYGDTRTLDSSVSTGAELGPKIHDLTAGAPTVLVILNHEDFWRRRHGADVPTLLGATYDLRDTTEFHTFKVFHFSLKDSPGDPAPGRAPKE